MIVIVSKFYELIFFRKQKNPFIVCFPPDQECKTESGPELDMPCIFPFNFQGDTYSECTSVEHVQPWCATEVYSSGNYVEGKWGNCNSYCSAGIHKS